jgi:precorrin-6Y C5,15-methyltransferase (decarboxylating)
VTTRPIGVVGLIGGQCFGTAAQALVAGAEVVVGSRRQYELVAPGLPPGAVHVELAGPLPDVMERIATEADTGRAVCVLASGDPGFFGIVRVLAGRFGSDRLAVHPAPSSVSLAFARSGTSWDDATVVSAHGRSLADAVAASAGAPKAAVLTSPDNPPQALGQALIETGCGDRVVTVVSRLGEDGEAVARTDLKGLAAGTFDPMSVVVLQAPDNTAEDRPSLAWGRSESEFAHRAGMITKAEVRAVALGKLGLPPAGVLWDIGAGSGSVGIEAARLAPGLRVFAVERVETDAARITENAAAFGVHVDVIVGDAPGALAGLPDPDRVFVGGGGLDVLDACLTRLRPGGSVVANYALVDRAVAAWERLGNMVQVQVSRAADIADGVRLAAENPVFICWGPAL